jgi:CxxC-x17-CxxC domain-containing protein
VPDRDIKCLDCGSDFVFTEREQEWYREKGLQHEPRRCKSCRSSRKTAAPPDGRPDGAGRGPEAHQVSPGPGAAAAEPAGATPDVRADRPRRPAARQRDMHVVACSSCGKETEVPFKPDLSRPVYCRDCYLARGKKR